MDKTKSIKIGDFARECGVSDRAIYKHIQKHEAELEGHLDKQGSNGTWLDETAQTFIRGLMLRQPVTVIQDNEDYRLLREENLELRQQLGKATEQLLKLQDILTTQATEIAEGRTAQKLLEASESRQSELEAKVEQGRLEAEKARTEENRAILEAQESQKRAAATDVELSKLKKRGLWSRITNKG